MKAAPVVAGSLLCLGVAVVSYGWPSASCNWDRVYSVLRDAVKNGTFPGCVAVVADKDAIKFMAAIGNFTYGNPAPQSKTNPQFTKETLFDLASLTKVLATTTSAMLLYQQGYLDLDMAVSDPSLLGSDFSVNGKEKITVRNLLLHNAGFPPDPQVNYSSKEMGCPETLKPLPQEAFSCQEKIYHALLNQTLVLPTGSQYLYSDLSMITLMYVIGTIIRDRELIEDADLNRDCVHNHSNAFFGPAYYSQCFYEAFISKHVFRRLGLDSMRFLLPRVFWKDTAPTWNDSKYRHMVMQGVVSDPNAYAMGGISGHAGLFSNVFDILALCRALLFAGADDAWLNSTTVAMFTKVYNLTQSSRALGWDTVTLCGTLSPTTFTHTGYTGTQVCNDPQRNITTILLTNRCYIDDSLESRARINVTRTEFNIAVQQAVDGC